MTSTVFGCLALLLAEAAGFAPTATPGHLAVHRTAHALHSVPRAAISAEEAPAAAGAADADADAELDALVRREVEAAFAGMEEALASGDEKKALSLIQTQGKEVLGNVLSQLESEGKLLSSELEARLETLASDQKVEMLKKYDEEYAPISRTRIRARARTRSSALTQLSHTACSHTACSQARRPADHDDGGPRDHPRRVAIAAAPQR